MKKSKIYFLVISLFYFGLISADENADNRPIGNWKLQSGYCNGVTIPDNVINRTIIFSPDNKFSTTVIQNGKKAEYNQGKYFMVDDSTMVMFHTTNKGNLSGVANTYYVKINKDELFLYGFYMAGNQEEGYASEFIEEWWFKTPSGLDSKE